MATHARQQYFADENSLSKERREFSIADEIQEKIDSVEEGAQVNKIETVKVNGTALVPDITKAVNVEVPDVIDNLYTVAADDALSAKQGKILYDYIQNLQTIGRFLSNWDTATGLPITNPSESPYLYKAGDYYRVSNVAVSPASNYKPDGSSYTIGVASTTVETLSVAVSDLYLYDGTDWILLSNSGSGIAVDSSLSTTSTNPVENRVVTNALNGKHPGAISNVVPSNPVEGMLWYDTTSDELKVYDGSNWTGVGGGDVLVSTQANNIFTPGMKIWGGTQSDFNQLTEDSNTAYLILADTPTPPSPGWQPGVNTIAYYPLDSVNTVNDLSGNNYTLTNSNVTFGTNAGVDCASFSSASTRLEGAITTIPTGASARTFSWWFYLNGYSNSWGNLFMKYGTDNTRQNWYPYIGNSSNHYFGLGMYDDIETTTPCSTGTWYNFVCVYNGTDCILYVNGQQIDSGAKVLNTQLSNLTIGGAGSDYINGYMSQLIIEDVAWTGTEVSDYYNQTKANYGIS